MPLITRAVVSVEEIVADLHNPRLAVIEVHRHDFDRPGDPGCARGVLERPGLASAGT